MSPLTRATCPPTRTGSGTSPSMARSASATATRTQAGAHRSAVSTRKGGGFYGYRIHAAVCTTSGLPVAWQVESANVHESMRVASLLDTLKGRGLTAETCALDKGYDNARVYGECEDRDVRPIIPLRETPDVKRGE